MHESTNIRTHESTSPRNKDGAQGFARTYRDLAVYRKAFELSLIIHRATLNFPKIEQYALADQLRRATKSICANITEGFDRQQFSKKEFRRFLMMASSSCAESMVWSDFALELKYIHANDHVQWQDGLDHVHRMLHRLIPAHDDA